MLLRAKIKTFNFLRLNQLRTCSNVANPQDNLINRQLKFPAYQPKNIENEVLNSKSITSNTDETFSILYPPPNITGNIHLGHCLTTTIQDVLIKWNQSKGIKTQWTFGTDHAGIATQVVVEKIVSKKYAKRRREIGRKAFLEEVWKWKNEKSNGISKDLRKLSASFDWDREYFTMDENHTEAVNEAFFRLFEQGIIYRDYSLINWSCALESAISDVEVENFEVEKKTQISVPNHKSPATFGTLTEFAYKIVGSDEEIVVATTRVETMLGDTAVAVNPNDPRYSHLINAKIWHPYRNEELPIIPDDSVDPSFGTGAVKITPAHDRNDFEVAKRHNLNRIQVITSDGLISEDFEEFSCLPRYAARDVITNDLAEKNLLRNVRDHKMTIPMCSRSKDVIEPMLKDQWFVSCKEMAAKAVEAVRSGELKIVPENFEREWFRWLENCHDWCISRQLWWGHQVPAYRVTTSDGKPTWMTGRSLQEIESKLTAKNYSIEQDPDVLDTWFSSALLPLSTSGWPHKIDHKNYPLTLMETGHDILFFWVARMVMLCTKLSGELPFKEVLLHGIVCDAFGRKMSKSLGNVIAPDHIINGASLKDLQNEIEISVKRGIIEQSEREKSLKGQRKMFPQGIQECGVDALRFTLCSQNIKQHFINFDVQECYANRLFFNKIWQATKYTINYAEKSSLNVCEMSEVGEVTNSMDLWILSRLARTLEVVDSSIENYNFHLATTALRTFFYNNLCDVYLETTKESMADSKAAHVLNICLSIGLKQMAFFTPYLASELLPYLPQNPSINIKKFTNEKLEAQMSDLLEICKSIRELKSHLKVTKKTDHSIVMLIKSNDHKNFILEHLNQIKRLTFTDIMIVTEDPCEFESEKFNATSTATHICSFGILIKDEIEVKSGEEINKKKLVKMEGELKDLLEKVGHAGFREKASEKVQKRSFEKIEKLKAEIANIKWIESH